MSNDSSASVPVVEEETTTTTTTTPPPVVEATNETSDENFFKRMKLQAEESFDRYLKMDAAANKLKRGCIIREIQDQWPNALFAAIQRARNAIDNGDDAANSVSVGFSYKENPIEGDCFIDLSKHHSKDVPENWIWQALQPMVPDTMILSLQHTACGTAVSCIRIKKRQYGEHETTWAVTR